mmetsp:Transcript_13355/g.13279  ORF Transcript_13355/g.13279 Transcript_13355/m.13279 type:complete len:261 (+) Transcript_13355:23-805(+)|eukprot:CAMPEP_0197016894 /NCGR_PEP_ID=MMETSP1380-20130617/79230_1 /TAXON_ID=5936 /ORGANISM="Euplotes crassus, Strain CT5" /LENGTH=260 /DNA_ID=CAMNT_0042443919 /DNA_START=606 /DNA_END=1388 /DNA_ORIENTATION=-
MNSSSESKEQEQEQVNSPTGEEQISLGCEEASSKSNKICSKDYRTDFIKDKTLSTKIIDSIISVHLGEPDIKDEASTYMIEMQQNKDEILKIAKKSTKLSLPCCENLDFWDIPAKNKKIDRFMNKSFPNQVDLCSFQHAGNVAVPIKFYLRTICTLSTKSLKSLEIGNFEITNSQLKKLVASIRHTAWVAFSSCILLTDEEPDLQKSLRGAQIEELNFIFTGSSEYSDWGRNLKRFQNIISALSKSIDVEKNLKRLIVED